MFLRFKLLSLWYHIRSYFSTRLVASGDNTIVTEKWCNTEAKFAKAKYKWTINNFRFRLEQMNYGYMKSSTFSTFNDENIEWQWCLELYCNGLPRMSEDHLSLYIRFVSQNMPVPRVQYTLSIVDSKCEKIRTVKSKGFIERSGWGFDKFIHKDVLLNEANRLLPDDKLTIFCEVSVMCDIVSISYQPSVIPFKVPKCHLSDDLAELFLNQEFADVTLLAKGRGELRAHKAILSARSSVFAAMFKHDMKERRCNIVEITDLDEEVLQEMLRFIYTGKSVNLEKMADKLLAAADKYELGRLKVMCKDVLYRNLSLRNAANVLIIADMHSVEQLKYLTIDFIKNHCKDVMDTPEWISMTQSHPHLVREISQALETKLIPPCARVLKVD